MPLSMPVLRKLVQIPIFGGLTVAEATEFFEVAVEVSAEKGTVLFREGDDGDALLVLLEGEVDVTRKGVELAHLNKNSVVGEMSLVDEGAPRAATVKATSDVQYLKVPAKRVQKLLKQNHVAALKVVANLARVMSKRLQAINDKLVASTGKKQSLNDFGKILTHWQF
jgi:CRP-like cAMP-binding protein